MKKQRKESFLHGIVIVHGKSEYQICQYIKSNLRLPIEIYSENRGSNSIQITSLNTILNNTIFKSVDAIIKEYPRLNVIGRGKNQRILDFKIFIIMDMDDCSKKECLLFKSGEMFKNHTLKEYICPIYNIPELESALKKSGIVGEKIKDKNKVKSYTKYFPSKERDIQKSKTKVEMEFFLNKLKSNEDTNMDEFVEYCLNCRKQDS